MPIFSSRPRLAALLHRHLDQLAHALLVDRLERIGLEDVVLQVVGQEAADVVAAEAEASSASGRWCRRRRTGPSWPCGRPAGTPAESRSSCRRGTSRRRPWPSSTSAWTRSTITLVTSSSLTSQVTGTMISGLASLAGLDQLGGRLEDGPDLHLGHLGIGDAQADAAVAHHRVGLVQLLAALLDVGRLDVRGPWPARPGPPCPAARTRAAAGPAGGWSPAGRPSPPAWP